MCPCLSTCVPALWGARSWKRRTHAFPPADVNFSAPVVFAPKVGRLQWVSQQSPRAGSSPPSASANLPCGIMKASRSLAGIQRAWGWLRPASLLPSLLFLKFSSAPFPPPGKEGAVTFLSTLLLLILLSPARPLSSVHNYLERAPLGSFGDYRGLALPSKCVLPIANGHLFLPPPLPSLCQALMGGQELASPNFDLGGPGNCRMQRFPETLAECLQ